jgi:hypothetical protein
MPKLLEYKAIIAAAIIALGLMLSNGIYKPIGIASNGNSPSIVNIWTGTVCSTNYSSFWCR